MAAQSQTANGEIMLPARYLALFTPKVGALTVGALTALVFLGVAIALHTHRQVAQIEKFFHAPKGDQEPSLSEAVQHRADSFVDTLNGEFSDGNFLRAVQRSAAEHDVQMTSSESTDYVSTGHTLGRLNLALSLHGPYPSLVATLDDILNRFPAATLTQMTLTRSSSRAVSRTAALPLATAPGASAPATYCDARVTFAFWSRPLQPAPSQVQ